MCTPTVAGSALRVLLLCAMLAFCASAHAQTGLGMPVAADLHSWDFGLNVTHSPARRYMAEWRLIGGMMVNDPHNRGVDTYSALLPLAQVVSAAVWSMFTPRPRNDPDTVATRRDARRSVWTYAALFGPLWLANSRHHLTFAAPQGWRLSTFGGARTHLYMGLADDEVWWVRTGPELGLRAYHGALEPDFMGNSLQGMSLEAGVRHDIDVVGGGATRWRAFLGVTMY